MELAIAEAAVCTDNAAMIGFAGLLKFFAGKIDGLDGDLKPLSTVPCHITYGDGTTKTIQIKCRIDTAIEIEYIEHGGVLHYVLRDLASR